MSSAATQSVPQTQAPPSMNSHSISTPPMSNRQYVSASNNNTASPSSSRRPSRRPSNNTYPDRSTVPLEYSSPDGNVSNSTTPRGPQIQTGNLSSPATDASPSSFTARAQRQEQRGGPPIPPPPRTSSNQSVPTRQASITADPLQIPTNHPRGAGDQQPSRPSPAGDAEREHDALNSSAGRERRRDDAAAAAASAARPRRRPQDTPPESSSRNSRTRADPSSAQAAATAATAATASGSTRPQEMSRENSEVINRVVVTDPQEDIARERARLAESVPRSANPDITPVTGLGLVGSEGVDDGGRGAGSSRQDPANREARRKENRFGDYILGQTLGEGEFGKVKMGWKRDGGVQVAIKLIRRETLGSNPSRLPKIYREIQILRGLEHPNIVRLHEMVETDRHIGIILEYASGGELFDHILNHRYLKDHAARRLFAQLVSGVGYLHKKGIVHRDLKLENLLLDRNRNIIITDFGFANTFDPSDELGEEIEYNLQNRDFVKKMNLDRLGENGMRRGDLMQTSCGSPCYAAPELVVSDSLYTGRKVDVWSCGVILYAMLAGYLPFDDDPANPEGDNINLLYKYIVSTPLTFPEYVTPHARDLLRRILVPDPRKRADLFEVARHSWLSEYSHVVSLITSSTTTTGEIANTTVTSDEQPEAPLLGRSASVREPTKTHQSHLTPVGGLAQKHGNLGPDQSDKSRDAKRRTVQVEYVPPQSSTARGERSPSETRAISSKTKARSAAQGPVEVSSRRATSSSKPLPQDPPVPREIADLQAQSRTSRPSTREAGESSRPRRDVPRSTSDSVWANVTAPTRPTTRESFSSSSGMPDSMRLPSRGNSYGQPVAPAVAATNAQGRLAQPKHNTRPYISSPIPQQDPFDTSFGRPSAQPAPPRSGHGQPSGQVQKGHKRSNTVGGLSEKIFGRPGSFFGGGKHTQAPEKPQKSYPPTSMSGPIASESPKTSTDSRRPSGIFRRRESDAAARDKPRRFSLLPQSFSLRNFVTTAKEDSPPATAQSMNEQKTSMPGSSVRYDSQRSTEPDGRSHPVGLAQASGAYDSQQSIKNTTGGQSFRQSDPVGFSGPRQYEDQRFARYDDDYSAGDFQYTPSTDPYREVGSDRPQQSSTQYPTGYDGYRGESHQQQYGRNARAHAVLQKNNRKFTDAYEYDPSGGAHHSGSSGAARKVMDFFRRRGRARAGE